MQSHSKHPHSVAQGEHSITHSSLRRFIPVGVLCYLALLALAACPILMQVHRSTILKQNEDAARKSARAAEEAVVKNAARETAREALRDTLEQDARELLEEFQTEPEFDKTWQEAWKDLAEPVERSLDELEAVDYAVDGEELESMLTQLRVETVDQLREQFETPLRTWVMENVLTAVSNAIPDAASRFLEQLDAAAASLAEDTRTVLRATADDEHAIAEALRSLMAADGMALDMIAANVADPDGAFASALASAAAEAASEALEHANIPYSETAMEALKHQVETMAVHLAEEGGLGSEAAAALTSDFPEGEAGEENAAGKEGPGPASSALAALASDSFGDGAGEALADAAQHAAEKFPGGSSNAPHAPGILIRLRAAADRGGRRTALGGSSKTVINLSQTFENLQAATQSAQSGLVVNQEWSDLDIYRESVDQLSKRRVTNTRPLLAPSLTAASTQADGVIAEQRSQLILAAIATNRSSSAEENTTNRTLYTPDFATFAYGGAPYATHPPTVDGDLSDWTAGESFALRAKLKQNPEQTLSLPPELEPNRFMMVQWNQTGLYIAYRMVDAHDNVSEDHARFWDNDSVELFFDFANQRPEKRTPETLQFWFWPLGSSLGPDIIGGSSSGWSFDPRFKRSDSVRNPNMAVKRTPSGYQVEIFLPKAVLNQEILLPGRIIAFNFSINNGEGRFLRWSVNRGRNISRAPSLWGDLLLLGTDATLAFTHPEKETPLVVVMPGEPLGLRVSDPDMNLHPNQRDNVEVSVSAADRSPMPGLLRETEPNSGIFQGSIDIVRGQRRVSTNATPNQLTVQPGDLIEMAYPDQARKYGGRYRVIRTRIPVGLPIYASGTAAATGSGLE